MESLPKDILDEENYSLMGRVFHSDGNRFSVKLYLDTIRLIKNNRIIEHKAKKMIRLFLIDFPKTISNTNVSLYPPTRVIPIFFN